MRTHLIYALFLVAVLQGHQSRVAVAAAPLLETNARLTKMTVSPRVSADSFC